MENQEIKIVDMTDLQLGQAALHLSNQLMQVQNLLLQVKAELDKRTPKVTPVEPIPTSA